MSGSATELGVNLSCGASNISFGMPGRHEIDAAFLTLMIGAGMNTAITNPLHRPVKKAILAADLLLGHDGFGVRVDRRPPRRDRRRGGVTSA